MRRDSTRQDEVVEIDELYGGEIRIEFRPNSKRNRYKVFDKGALVKPSPPSVTGITSLADFGKSNALSAWSAKCVIEYLRGLILPDQIHRADFLEDSFTKAQYNYRDIKDAAASVGTAAHSALERYFKQDPGHAPPLKNTPVRALYDSALAWFDKYQIELICAEAKVYSRETRTVGTLDNLCRIDSIPSIVDFKASRSVYPAYVMQMSAYLNFWEEEHPNEPLIEQAFILQLTEDRAIPYHYDRYQLDQAYESFLALRRVYSWEKELGKLKPQELDWIESL